MSPTQKALLNTQHLDEGEEECMACGYIGNDDAGHAWNCIYNEGGAA